LKNIKRNKKECAELMENVHEVLYTIINLYLKSETVGSLPPAMVDNIGKFMEQVVSPQKRAVDKLPIQDPAQNIYIC
jgi:hypothetical protein